MVKDVGPGADRITRQPLQGVLPGVTRRLRQCLPQHVLRVLIFMGEVYRMFVPDIRLTRRRWVVHASRNTDADYFRLY
ncbi:hypothetical protein E2C01_022343 [Portunus trituberculatus]|uniref:Uncharacterized protein n=1 Tax=Portunus trituberculatus TaxID=210409 RepID=A0A5B7E7F4_PORTR|nr:hypothetical protein [Portunus trituberculatus]